MGCRNRGCRGSWFGERGLYHTEMIGSGRDRRVLEVKEQGFMVMDRS